MTNAIELCAISKTFPGVVALDKVDFAVRMGEIHGLVGKNGAGKSTLMSVLAGLYGPDSGTILVRGQTVTSMTPARAKALGVAIVSQHVQLVPGLSIAENMLCGNLPTNRLGFVDWRATQAEAQARLQRFGLNLDVRRLVQGLSVAEQQMIDIAKALFADASVIVLDEPTAPLPKSEVETLFKFVRLQRERGASFVYISHYLEELFELCDRVTVLRNGRTVATHEIKDIDQPQLIQLISGAEIERFQRDRPRTKSAVPVLAVEGLTRLGVYEEIALTLNAGEIVGITGLEGCGKDRLARGLFGLEPLGQGRVFLEGRPYLAISPADAIRAGVVYVPRDRHGLGMVGRCSVRENMTLPFLNTLTNAFGLLKHGEETALVQRYIEMLGIKTASMATNIENLSGGNQQKVVVAKLAATKPKVLFLDEPTQGVDVQAKVEILRIIGTLAKQDAAVVMVTEEIGEMLDTCDRILVMSRGRMIKEFHLGAADTTHTNILTAIEGVFSAAQSQR